MNHKGIKASSLRVVDLFCGGGGMSMGFQNAGFPVVASVDNWQVAIAHCKANFAHDVKECDLADTSSAISLVKDYIPDIMIGGPPCQDFSSAGKRNESGGRADLTVSYAEIVAAVRPAYFVMENVERAIRSKAFAIAMEIFKKAGYGTTTVILDASRCGVPQIRKRLFVIGSQMHTDGFLHEHLMEGQSSKQMTLREYFGKKISFDHYYRHPRSYARRGVFSVDEPSPTIRGVNRPVPSGYPGHPGDPVPVNSGVSPLTTRQRAMVQTFPESYLLNGGKSDLEQLIGNAVPVKLAEHVAMALRKFLSRSAIAKQEAFVLYEDASKYSSSTT
jgi:DNA (cytosine-5)-methyltransferase 1